MKKTVTLFFVSLLYISTFSQVAINTTGNSPDASSILDISTTTGGVLIPRLSTTERNAIQSPANGLLVYDTERDSFWYYDMGLAGWVEITTSATNSLDNLMDGISDGVSVYVGSGTGVNDYGNNNNTGIGVDALNSNTSGSYNNAMGYKSLYSNTGGDQNTASGNRSLYTNTTGFNNTSSGYSSLKLNTTGNENTAFGAVSMFSNTTGSLNTAHGTYSLYSNTTGLYNTVMGHGADAYNEQGSNNTIIGSEAGKGSSTHSKSGNIFLGFRAGYNETSSNKLYIENSNSSTPLIGGDFANDSIFLNGIVRITGSTPGADKVLTSDANGNSTWETPQWGATQLDGLNDGKSDGSSIFLGANAGLNDDGSNNRNTGIGTNALKMNTTGSTNTASGYYSLYSNTTGFGNTAFGNNSLYTNTTGRANTAISVNSLISNTTGYNNTTIGNSSLYHNTTGYNNTASGLHSLFFNSSGIYNTAYGCSSLKSNSIGSRNTAIGMDADFYNEEGSNNTIIGYAAGKGSSTHNKSGNIFLGYQSGYNETGSNKLYIENSNSTTPLIGGDFANDSIFLNGVVRITGGTPGIDKVLTSDADGNATWEPSQSGATEINDLSDGSTLRYSLFLGSQTGNSATESYNVGLGFQALMDNTSGSSNTATGTYSLQNNLDGANNVATGMLSLASNTSGSYNVGIGYDANFYNETGSNNTIIGNQAGRGTSAHNKSGNIFLGYRAGYNETGSDKLYIENSLSSSPLIGGDFSTDEVYFNTLKLGIGTSIPRELLEVASPTNSYGRMIVSDGGGDSRNALLFVSPIASNQVARIEAFDYGAGAGLTLKFNTTGDGQCIFGGNVLPEGHKTEDLGGNGQAWNNVYAHNYVTQGSAAFTNIVVTQQLINFPPIEKAEGSFDEFTEKGLKELDPASLPENLRDKNAILIDEMTTYNYKANYEQQLLIETLKEENAELKIRLDRLEKILIDR